MDDSFCFLDIVAYAAAIAYSRTLADRSFSYYLDKDEQEKTWLALLKTQAHGFTIANFLDCFSDIFVFLTLARISSGIIIAQTGTSGKLGKLLRIVSYPIAVLLGTLAVAFLGLRIDFHVHLYTDEFFDESHFSDSLMAKFNPSRQINFSFRVLVFILALLMVARSVMVKLQTRTESRVKTVSQEYSRRIGKRC